MLINDIDEIYSLSDWVIQKANEDGSVWTKFLELFTVEFVLDNLDTTAQKQFLQMLSEGNKGAVDFACGKIKNFNDKYAQALTNKVLVMLEGKEVNAQN
jgi:hypothetical protein